MPNCCVFGCNNNLKNSNMTLHNFPREEKEPRRYKAWTNRINRENFKPNPNHVVCSEHFNDEDFVGRYKKDLMPQHKVVRRLSKTAIPSLHLTGNKDAEKAAKRPSTYIRKKIVSDSINDTLSRNDGQGSSTMYITEDPNEMDTTTQTVTESIGIQCELGAEIYYKYSNLYEDNNCSDDRSVRSLDFSEVSEDESGNDGFVNENYDEEEKCDLEVDTESENCPEDSSASCKIILVQIECLLSLCNTCQKCKSEIKEKKAFARGAVYHVKYVCIEGHCNKWSSWNDPRKCTIHLSSALLLNGINFLPFTNFAQTLNLLFISHGTYYKTIKRRIAPVIHDFWVKHKAENYNAAKSEEDLWISGDGQYDSPGFSAKYITYSIMDVKSKKILDFVLLQRRMVEGELERAACEKALAKVTSELPVKLFLSDRHRGVGVVLRTIYPQIMHEFDVWHLAKSLVKRLSKAEKKSRILSQWSRAITNHLWWSAETCGGNSEVLIEKFTSLLKHICNIHEWDDGAGNKKTCEHEKYSATDNEEIKWIRFGSADYQALSTEIMNRMFLNDLRHTSHFCHTGALESYHNVRLKYVPKRIHFSYEGMYIRSILAILDHNFNVGRDVIGGVVNFSKATKQWNYKKKYVRKDNTWKLDLLGMILDKSSTEVLKQLSFEVPQNISNVEKPSLEAAKAKHFSRFKCNLSL